MIARILSTPIAAPPEKIPAGKRRPVSPDVLAAVLPGPGRDRLAAGDVLAVAGANALQHLRAGRGSGLAVFRAHDRSAKRAAAPWILRALDETLADGLTPVMVEGRLGRDRLRGEGGEYVTRRSGERFTRA